MNIQSWMIKSWTTLECYLSTGPDKLPRFKHASTQVRDDGSSGGFRAGDTVWIAQDEQWPAGLAWEWVEVRPGLVMLSDPNSIITNLQMVDKDRQIVTGLAKVVCINRLVHALDWQMVVRSYLNKSAAQCPAPLQAGAPWRHDSFSRFASHPGALHAAPAVHRPPLSTPLSSSLRDVSTPRREAEAATLRKCRTRASDLENGPAAPITIRELRKAA